MKPFVLHSIMLCIALMQAAPSMANNDGFSFGVIAHPFRHSTNDAELSRAIEESDADNLAFIVVNGLKASDEPCTDRLYEQRMALLQSARNGLIVSLAASDWAECRSESGRSSAIGKLNRLRELLFGDEFSLGTSRIPVIRQSTIAKFRGFPENARWEIDRVMFATVNIPANNNHYVLDAGRNSEFEDRLVANRDWLNRVFTFARHRKLDAVVLFCDGNPLGPPQTSAARRDGYAETRKLINTLATKFPGKVLIVHGQNDRRSGTAGIRWRGNLAELGTGPGWRKVTINRSQPALFSTVTYLPQAANHR
jgi:hypothetical protein